MLRREKILFYFGLLVGLRAKRENMTYGDAGDLTGTHYRHISRLLAVIQVATDVYNLLNETQVPHLNALIVHKRDRKPGDGCVTTHPHSVQLFDFSEHLDGIKTILEFVSQTKFEHFFKELDYENQAPTFLKLYQTK